MKAPEYEDPNEGVADPQREMTSSAGLLTGALPLKPPPPLVAPYGRRLLADYLPKSEQTHLSTW